MRKSTTSRRNLIVTCGTSQMGKLNLLGLAELKPITELTTEMEHLPPDVFLANPNIQAARDKIVAALVECYQTRKELVPLYDHKNWWLKNPFGAELSTLIRMEGMWNPLEDKVVLLASDTNLGMLSCDIVRGVLEHPRSFQALQVQARRVKELEVYTQHPETAQRNLVYAVYRNLFPGKDLQKNILVVTGGFKSLIPNLTLFALLFGIEMVYLFEQSTKLQRLRFLDFSKPGRRKEWEAKWKEWEQQGWLQIDAVSLKNILQVWGSTLEDPPPPIDFGF